MKSTHWVIHRTDIGETYQDLANQMLSEMHIQKRSLNTLCKYRRVLENFLIDCPESMSDFTSGHIKQWIDQYSLNKKPTTMDLVMSVISKYLKFCHGEGYFNGLTIKKWWWPKLEKSLPKFLEQNELAKVEHMAEKLPLRDRLLTTFLITSGCRTMEVINLKKEDIDLEMNTAWVLGKRNKRRYVHFSEACGLLFQEHLENHPPDLNYVFYHKYKKRLGYQRLKRYGIYRVVVELGKKAGLSTPLFPHRLRHTFATNLLTRGADLKFVQEELGHNEPDTTRIYARLPIGNIIPEYAKVMD